MAPARVATRPEGGLSVNPFVAGVGEPPGIGSGSSGAAASTRRGVRIPLPSATPAAIDPPVVRTNSRRWSAEHSGQRAVPRHFRWENGHAYEVRVAVELLAIERIARRGDKRANRLGVSRVTQHQPVHSRRENMFDHPGIRCRRSCRDSAFIFARHHVDRERRPYTLSS
jgi:hypothetical protein